MTPFLVKLDDAQLGRIRNAAKQDNVTVAAFIRRSLAIAQPVCDSCMSGAQVLGVKVITTSGDIWLRNGGR